MLNMAKFSLKIEVMLYSQLFGYLHNVKSGNTIS